MDPSAQFLHNSNMLDKSSRDRIRAYNLFGETGDMPDLVHCERISERSKLHNWELAPHRHARLHQLLVIERGGGRAILEGDTHTLAAHRMVNVPTGCVHAFVFTPATEGYVLTIAAEVFDEVLREGEGLRAQLAKPWVGTGVRTATPLMRSVLDEYAGMRFGRAHIVRALCAQLAGLVARAIDEAGDGAMRGADASLMRRFETLLDEHFLQQWSVSDYAAHLACAPGHLSRVCRQASGMSASKLIEARLVREARRLLAFTGLGIAQIAYELGFNDPAYFTRVFSRAAGLSPRRFRDRLQSGNNQRDLKL